MFLLVLSKHLELHVVMVTESPITYLNTLKEKFDSETEVGSLCMNNLLLNNF